MLFWKKGFAETPVTGSNYCLLKMSSSIPLAVARMQHMTAAHAEDALKCLFLLLILLFKKKKLSCKVCSSGRSSITCEYCWLHSMMKVCAEWSQASGSLQIFSNNLEQSIFAFHNSSWSSANAYSPQRQIYIPWQLLFLCKAVFHLLLHKS